MVVLPRGKKEGSMSPNFVVGISFSKGVFLCEQYYGPMTRTKVADILDSSFDSTFQNSINPVLKRFSMEGILGRIQGLLPVLLHELVGWCLKSHQEVPT